MVHYLTLPYLTCRFAFFCGEIQKSPGWYLLGTDLSLIHGQTTNTTYVFPMPAECQFHLDAWETEKSNSKPL